MRRRNIRRLLPGAGFVVVSVFAANVVFAADQAGTAGIDWKCVQEQDEYFHVLCVPRPARPEQPRAPEAVTPGADGGSSALEERPSNGETGTAKFGRDMRPVAARGAAEVFSARAWRLPLYARSRAPDAVKRLLETVLCGDVQRCSVTYDAS
jgi:hypothetical protein